jgi:hypothetical protein
MPHAKAPTALLEEAIDRYRAAFGAEALPCLCCVTDAAKAVAAAMLEHAVCTRRPLRYGQVSAALGQTTPLGGSL